MAIRSSQPKTTERGKSTRRSAAGTRESVLQMLKDDHKHVKKAFREFEKLDPHQDPERCAQLVEQTCNELEIHARIEEDLFYPAVRQAIQDEDLMHEAEVEHKTAKMLIEELRGMSPEDEKFGATFTVLGEYVKHHIQEEEKEMFGQLERAKVDWTGLLEAMQTERDDLMSDYGIGDSETGEMSSSGGRGGRGSRSGGGSR